MRVVTTKQGGKDWHAWRGTGLGASDAPAVMGVSPYQTRFELWAEKTGLLARQELNPFAVAAMRRGNELEPVARAKYEKEHAGGVLFPPVSGEHDDFPEIRASLDGYNVDLNKFIEIKCPGKEDQSKARKGIVPDKYAVQMQVQFAVTGAESADYVSFDGKDELIVIPVKPDKKFQGEIIQSMREFWELVTNKTPPKTDVSEYGKVIQQMEKDLEKLTKGVNTLRVLINAAATNQYGG